MKLTKAFIALLTLIAVCTIALPLGGQARQKTEIKWMTIEEAYEANAKKPKKIFIDVYTDWCGWCKRMDKETFQNESIAAYMNEHFYAVKFNAEQKETVTLGKQEFKYVAEGNRGYHQLAVALMQGRMSYPTVVVMNEKFQLLAPYPGYKSPDQMKPLLEFYANNQHLKAQPKTQGK